MADRPRFFKPNHEQRMVALAGIIILGIFAQWIAWKMRVPAILPLILIGLFVGPISTLFTPDGTKWIEPIYQGPDSAGIFPRQQMFYFVSLAIGIILFEGGLTLNRNEVRGIGPVIGKLITVGPLITLVGGGIGAHFIMGLNWQVSLLFAALVTVTGPTVIAPILRNVPLQRNVANILKWEGILIDPIGALLAVLMFEFIISGANGQEFSLQAIKSFITIILIGLAMGTIAAYALFYMIKKDLIPHYLLNVFTLALVLLVFVLSDVLEHESGLLTVVVMGMVLGNLDVPRLKEILDFKESLSVLLISILFIDLSANMDMDELQLLVDWRCVFLFVLVVFILRPLGVFSSTLRSGLKTNEKLFVSWVGPRGIVAAGIASLFGLRLVGQVEGAEYITPLVFMIVLGTVLINATTARLMARLLGVRLESSEGIFIVGANKPARLIGKYLTDNDRHVVLVDNNKSNVIAARNDGLEAIQANIYTEDLEENFELLDMGYMLALTSSAEVNRFATDKYSNVLGEVGTFRLLSSQELKMDKEDLPNTGLVSYVDDYLNLSEAARDYPSIHLRVVDDQEEFKAVFNRLQHQSKSIPLFIKTPDGRFEIIPKELDTLKIKEGSELVYLGAQLVEEQVEKKTAKGAEVE